MNRIVVHAGTHKTGTTTLQIMLGRRDENSPHPELFVPWSGRYPSPGVAGHHNVAWQLNGDPRFRPENGTLDELAAEVASRNPAVAVISSEDLEYLHTRPEALERMATTFRAIGYEPHIVLYVRSREEYAQSLYAELVKHGLSSGFEDFLKEVRESGLFTFAQNWAFRFRYSILIERFEAAFGTENVVVRPYRSGADNLALERDFVSVLFGPTAGSAFAVPGIGRANPSLDLLGVLNALHANLPNRGSGVPDAFALAADVLEGDERDVLSLKFAPFDESDRAAFRAHFTGDDEVLRDRYGIEDLDSNAIISGRAARLQKRVMLAAEERWNLRSAVRDA
jgi:hypothetical protein